MADRNWLDADGTFDNVANYTGAAVPIAGEPVTLGVGDKTISVNMPVVGIDYSQYNVGPNFQGKIGTSAARMVLGTVARPLEFFGTRCKEAWLVTDAAKTNSINVRDTGAGDYALVLYSGTFQNVNVERCTMVRMLATTTTLRLLSAAARSVLAETGCVLTNALVYAGLLDLRIAPSLVRCSGGVVQYGALSALTVAEIEVSGTGEYQFASNGGTITLARVLAGGRLNLNCGPGVPRTITTLELYPGGVLDRRGLGKMVTITTFTQLGGQILDGD